jgi:hypothetical protein
MSLPCEVSDWTDTEFSCLTIDEQAELVLMLILLARGSWRPVLGHRPIRHCAVRLRDCGARCRMMGARSPASGMASAAGWRWKTFNERAR